LTYGIELVLAIVRSGNIGKRQMLNLAAFAANLKELGNGG